MASGLSPQGWQRKTLARLISPREQLCNASFRYCAPATPVSRAPPGARVALAFCLRKCVHAFAFGRTSSSDTAEGPFQSGKVLPTQPDCVHVFRLLLGFRPGQVCGQAYHHSLSSCMQHRCHLRIPPQPLRCVGPTFWQFPRCFVSGIAAHRVYSESHVCSFCTTGVKDRPYDTWGATRCHAQCNIVLPRVSLFVSAFYPSASMREVRIREFSTLWVTHCIPVRTTRRLCNRVRSCDTLDTSRRHARYRLGFSHVALVILVGNPTPSMRGVRIGEASNPGPVIRMPGDGHCLYHALGWWVGHTARHMRRLLAEVELHRFLHIFDWAEASDHQVYVQETLNPRIWGGAMQIAVAADRFASRIDVFTPWGVHTYGHGDPWGLQYRPGVGAHYDVFVSEHAEPAPHRTHVFPFPKPRTEVPLVVLDDSQESLSTEPAQGAPSRDRPPAVCIRVLDPKTV